MAGPDDFFTIPVRLDLTEAQRQKDEFIREGNEGVTFANPGGRGGGAEAMRERVVRAQERTADTIQGVGGGVWDKQSVINAQLSMKEWASRFAARDAADAEYGVLGRKDSANSRGFFSGYDAPLDAPTFSNRRDDVIRRNRELRQSRRDDRIVSRGGWVAGRDDVDDAAEFDFSSGYDGGLEASVNDRHEETLRQQRRLRRRRSALGNAIKEGWGESDEFSENFGSNLDDAIADAQGKGEFPEDDALARRRRQFGPRRRGGRGNNMSVFYKRFLMMEALRSVGQIAEVSAAYGPSMIEAGGDLIQEAEVQYRTNRGFADAVPFGIGQLGYAIGDTIGPRNAEAIASAKVANNAANTAQRQYQYQMQLVSISRQADIASTPRGLGRDLVGMSAEEEDKVTELRQKQREHADDRAEVRRQRISELDESRPSWWEADVSDRGPDHLGSNADIDAQINAITQQGAADRARTAQENAKAEADLRKVYAVRRGEAFSDAMRESVGNVLSGSLALGQAGRLLRPQGTEFYDPEYAARQNKQQIDFGNETADRKEEQDYADVRAKNQGFLGGIISFAYRINQLGQRGIRYAQTTEQKRAIDANTEREVGLQSIGYREDYLQSRSELNRDPRGGITARYDAERERNMSLPPTSRVAADDAATARRDAANQAQDDRMALMGGSLMLALGVSNMRAQAYGPGADARLRGAHIAEIAGSAELAAQQVFRDPTIDHKNGQAQQFANAQRQIGINNLSAYAAEYSRGFTSVQEDVRHAVPNNRQGSNPSEVFHSIDDGIQTLKNSMGGDGNGPKISTGGDTTNSILQQILQALTNNGVLAHAG